MSDPVTRVSIDTPPLTVTVEAPGAALEDVRRHAVEVYREIWHSGMHPGLMGGNGLGFERSGP